MFLIFMKVLAAAAPAFAASYVLSKIQNKKIIDIENHIFVDLGEFVEIRKPKAFGFSKSADRKVKKSDVVTIQKAGVVSLFFMNKGVMDIFVTPPNIQAVVDRAVELFSAAELVVIE